MTNISGSHSKVIHRKFSENHRQGAHHGFLVRASSEPTEFARPDFHLSLRGVQQPQAVVSHQSNNWFAVLRCGDSKPFQARLLASNYLISGIFQSTLGFKNDWCAFKHLTFQMELLLWRHRLDQCIG